jgi:multicomponent Na+:H+ antiporter subunit D
MSDLLIVLPVMVPLTTAALTGVAWRAPRVQRALGVLGAATGLAGSLALATRVVREGPAATQAGGWQAPYGITLVADELSAVMVVVAALMGLAVMVYGLAEISSEQQLSAFVPLVHVLMMGVQGAFLTGDLFNLYVCFEVMLMASFVLLALGGERAQMEGALTYVTLNLLASALFLAGVGLVYGATKTLNLADLSVRLAEVSAHSPALVAGIAGLFLVAFGIKAGVFPLYAWLPASYHTPPVAVAALFAGLLTKVGVYALLRVVPLLFGQVNGIFQLLLWAAVATMLAGVIGAVAQFQLRRVLGFHIVSQIGYMVLGLGLLSSPEPAVRRLALAAAVFYVAHHIVVKTNLYLIGGVVRRLGGGEELKSLGGLAVAAPWLAALFAVPAASLAGIPPLSGFWAKLGIVRAGLEAAEWWAVVAALVAGALTLVSMVKIWNEAFWKAAPGGPVTAAPVPWAMVAPIVLLAALTLAIGLVPGPLLDFAHRAADSVLDPAAYRAVVGGGR